MFPKETPPRLDSLIGDAVTVHEAVHFGESVRVITSHKTLHLFNMAIFCTWISPDSTWTPIYFRYCIKVERQYKFGFLVGVRNFTIQALMHKPYGFILSYPSICHVWLGPLFLYRLRINLRRLLAATPSGSNRCKRPLTIFWDTENPSWTHLLCIHLYPYNLPDPCNCSSINIATRRILFSSVNLRNPNFRRILRRCLWLIATPSLYAKHVNISFWL